jgi:hypothetical protein
VKFAPTTVHSELILRLPRCSNVQNNDLILHASESVKRGAYQNSIALISNREMDFQCDGRRLAVLSYALFQAGRHDTFEPLKQYRKKYELSYSSSSRKDNFIINKIIIFHALQGLAISSALKQDKEIEFFLEVLRVNLFLQDQRIYGKTLHYKIYHEADRALTSLAEDKGCTAPLCQARDSIQRELTLETYRKKSEANPKQYLCKPTGNYDTSVKGVSGTCRPTGGRCPENFSIHLDESAPTKKGCRVEIYHDEG